MGSGEHLLGIFFMGWICLYKNVENVEISIKKRPETGL